MQNSISLYNGGVCGCLLPSGVRLWNFLRLLIGQDASFWQWFWRCLYCLYRLVSALVDHERNVQSLYRCTHRYPRGAPELRGDKKLCFQSLGY